MRKKLIIAIIIAALAAGGAWWYRVNKAGETTTTVKTARAELGTLTVVASATGGVQADLQVEIKSRAAGEVIELAVEPGHLVKEGDLLARLDPTDEERNLADAAAVVTSSEAKLAQAEAAYASSQADEIEARAKAERRQNAYAAGLVSLEELRSAQTAVEVAGRTLAQRRSAIASARADLERSHLTTAQARKRLDETVIRSPIAGTVLSTAVERGNIVSSGITNVGGGTALMTIGDLSRLSVVVKLDEAEIGSVKGDQPASIRVDAFPTRRFTGVVERVTPFGVNVSNVVTFDVKVAVTDPESSLLLPGMSADIEIETAHYEDVLLIPVAAVRSEGRQRYVLLAGGEKRSVRTGATDGKRIIVTEGLQPGEEVIEAGAAPTEERARGLMRFGRGGRR